MQSVKKLVFDRLAEVKKLVFDRLAEVTKADKTNNSHSSAYIGTIECELCSKSKCLA